MGLPLCFGHNERETKGKRGGMSVTSVIANTFSGVLLELTRMCYELPIDEFRQQALGTIGRAISCDKAWWALVTEREQALQIHSSCQIGLPDGCEELLNLTHGENVVGNRCRSAPGEAFVFGPECLYGNMATAVLAAYMDIQHVIAVTVANPQLNQSMFLSFARRETDQRFTESDRRLVQLVTPHLIELEQINFFLQIAQWRSSSFPQQAGLAVVDANSIIHAADSAFIRLLTEEWPSWNGPKLPEALVGAIGHGATGFLGKQVAGEFSNVGKLLTITLRERSPLEELRQREREIALAFARGDSYKEVAKSLSISPATVRHHLRKIYEKLGISDKAALANLINLSGDEGRGRSALR